jgi:cyclic beta-1,2-glucan synthetase
MIEKQAVSFSTDYLKKSAVNLAKSHDAIMQGHDVKKVKQILDQSKEVLLEAYRTLSRLAKSEQDISPAAEWIIDNFYIIQEQMVQMEVDFPKEYQISIPVLRNTEYKGLPRVYEIILNFLTHTDNLLDVDALSEYIQNYQEEETLTLGEIWAIPIMIRFILIQKLAEKSDRILYRKKIQKKIYRLIKQIGKKQTYEPGEVLGMISDWVRGFKQNSFDVLHLVELHNQLQAAGLLYDEQKRWFSYRFRHFDMTLDEAMRIEAQKQSRLQVSIQNAVASLRSSSETDWSEFVETCSITEQILRLDPSGLYPNMDFNTRDNYRKSVERLSRNSGLTESEVAEMALLLAEEHSARGDNGMDDYLHNHALIRNHIGYFLVGEGYSQMIRKTGYTMPVRERITRFFERHTGYYLLLIGLQTLVLLGILWLVTGTFSESALFITAVLLVSLFPALDLSVTSVNRFFAFFLPPRILPKMDYREGIPKESRTMVIVPTILSNPESVKRQVENLEIRSLANPDPTLQFVLLSDFPDSDEKEKEGDDEIIQTAKKEIRALNDRYRSDFGDKFFLMHRDRLWNPSEQVWMGWERKRGKLEEFNHMLCDPVAKTSYKYIEGRFSESVQQAPVKFVITLDADTKLPPDSAKNLVRTISHPLNRAWYHPDKKRITKGYAVIQPRISIPPESTQNTWFSRIFSGNVGIDPYSTAVSDIYQDLAGEAVFTGKGIYDVKAFHKVLNNIFPDNRILSHDLIESTYLRTGLASDIELFDDYPSTYLSFSKRNHRWTRGDWQIASWLFSKVPSQNGKVSNPINLLSRWKIFDNLRRSLNPFFLTLFFVAGWFLMPGPVWVWTLAGFGILAYPIYATLTTDLLNRPTRVRWKLYLDKVRANLKMNSIQAISTLIILPHQALVHLDAIIRTLYRLSVSRKNLLEWTTAFQTEKISPNQFSKYLLSMIGSVALGAAIWIIAIAVVPHHLWIVVPFSLLWMGAPIYLWQISRPRKPRHIPYTEQEKKKLRMYARRTWFYFERFLNEDHSWLPPDNFQEDPELPPAARTSPTNIGLGLTSTIIAYNMGYITLSEMLERLVKSLQSMKRLERYKGHFYNWYDTRLGEVLSPRYVSTVDSGNLAAGLIVIKEAVKQEMNTRGFNAKMHDGLKDTIMVIRDIFNQNHHKDQIPDHSLERVMVITELMLNKLNSMNERSVAGILELLKSLKEDAASLSSTDLMPLRNLLGDQKLEDLLFWIETPLKQIEKAIAEYRCITMPEDVEPHSYTPEEFCRIMKECDDLQCELLFATWKQQADEIVSLSETFIREMDFSFLYLKKRGLFSIGYNAEKAQLDKGTYDLLASEARIASYIAISRGDVPVEHWFRLSRRLTSLNQNEILLSWGGTMFEYLMPLLFQRSYPETLMSHTYQNVVRWQKEYGDKRDNPWGFSESAYYFLNLDMHYQYRAFGAPGLGLKRGLAEEYVVAPYASMLALMVEPKTAYENLRNLEKKGGLGLHGFYDAIDFTPSRLKKTESFKIVKTYMAHHHGMSLIALENLLNDWSVNNYFHSDPAIKSCELILQERIPRGVPIKEPHPIEVELEPGEQEAVKDVVDHASIDDLDASPPRLHTLSNGSYSVFISHAGTGSSRCNGVTMNAWEPDAVSDPLGFYFYVKDTESGKFWSAMHQPVKHKPDRYDTWFHNGKIVTSRVDEWIETTTEVCVSPDHPIELRKLTLTNYSDQNRTLEITSYAEIVLNRMADHRAHPAFSKLFVQTDYLAEHHSIIAKRRPRGEHDKTQWLVHTFAGMETENLTSPLQFETDRLLFIGRGRSLSNPAAMDPGHQMTGSVGNVLDPVISLRKSVTLKPGEKAELTFGLGSAPTREKAVQMADIYDNRHAANRTFNLAAVYSSVELSHIGITPKQAHYFQKLSSYVIYSNTKYRTDEKTLNSNRKKQQDLWAYGISGDLPLIVFRINNTDQLKHINMLLKAHAFWSLKGIETELIILNDHPPSYADEVQEAIQQAVETSMNRESLGKYGGVFLVRTDRIADSDLALLLTVAHCVFEHSLPNLSKRSATNETTSWYIKPEEDRFQPLKAADVPDQDNDRDMKQNLQFFNGYGGFSDDGNEYHMLMKRDSESGELRLPPAPWINVITNPQFGFIATERGAGYTWSENSRENKLTEWSNDPVKDPHSEAFYIRDEEERCFWSPAPGPVAGPGTYITAHGFGYTRYRYRAGDLSQNLVQFAASKDAVKISRLTIKNHGPGSRKLSVFHYLGSVLGINRASSVRYIQHELSEDGRTIYARNYYNNEFAGRTVFARVLPPSQVKRACILQRTGKSFIGRNRSLNQPLECKLPKRDSDGTIQTGGDSLHRISVRRFRIEPGETISLAYLHGEAKSRRLADKDQVNVSAISASVDSELESVQIILGGKTLDVYRVSTPEPSLESDG